MPALKQSTTKTVRLGPFVDATDGVTPETGLAGTMVVYLSKNGGAFAARNSATAITHDRDGWYAIELDATDTSTMGELVVEVTAAATHAPVWKSFDVEQANVFESLRAGTEFLETTGLRQDVIRSSDNLNVYKRDDTTLQFSKAGTWTAPGSADVLTQLGS